MRVVAVSDTHGMLSRVDVPDGDVLVHAGDATAIGSSREVEAFAADMAHLPHRVKIMVAGNHDWMFQRRPVAARRIMLDAGVTYLEDAATLVDGILFYGSPWQPEFCAWAFNLPRGPELRAKWDMIPAGVDVLITHGPPHGMLDQVRDPRRPDGGGHLGCEELSRAVARVRPQAHVFGHIHDSYGTAMGDKTGVYYVNASTCTESYRPTNAPVVFEVTAR